MTDDPQFLNLPLIATFLKHFNRAYLGPQADATPAQEGVRANGVEDLNEHSTALPEGMEELIPKEIQKGMREIFVGYFNSAGKTLVKGQIVRPLTICLPHDAETTFRDCSSKTSGITRRTSSLAKSSRIANTPMSA